MSFDDLFIKDEPKEELQPGDLVRVYVGKDAQGHIYHRKLGIVIGTIRKPTSFMQFFTYRVLVGMTVARIHEVWIQKVEIGKETDETL